MEGVGLMVLGLRDIIIIYFKHAAVFGRCEMKHGIESACVMKCVCTPSHIRCTWGEAMDVAGAP